MSILTRWVHYGARNPSTTRRDRPDPRPAARLRLHVERLEDRWVPTTYTVNSLADTNTPGTLRFAIGQANANNTGTAAVPDVIQFNTGGGTINVVALALPTLTDIAVIDGTTATGYAGVPIITLDGAGAPLLTSGLIISAGSSTVQGLAIVRFGAHGIRLDTNGGNTIRNNYIGITTANAVAANGANGVFINGSSDNAIGGTGASDANVISGNGGDGVLIDGTGATGNRLVANFIGTDATGTAARSNAGNGVRVTNGARANTIGGSTPTATPFTGKPVDGNVISGNLGNGVLLTTGAGFNTLSGNFIGTNLAGTGALGNALDGVAILNGANNNALIGTTFPQLPFVYLNVVSGNLGNGLRIQDSDNTTVQANSFGLGDDNITPVGNGLNGVLIEGSSANTQFGGVIPLGNIVAANGANGVEIRDTASGTVCFNTFCGLPAFTDTAVGNALDGFLITSTGGNTLLRTNVIAGNLGNGVHISGSATGVRVEEDIIGMNTSGQLPLPNGGNGVLIDGTASGNIIGGFQVSVITQNTISANGGYGVAIVGAASGNQVFHSFIGTNILGGVAFGNAAGGIFIGGTAQGTTIGGTGAFDQNLVSGNGGAGIVLGGTSQGTQVLGNLIGTDRTGRIALPNQGDGVSVAGSNNLIGGTATGTGNVIAFNTGNGVGVTAGAGNGVLGNSIFGNAGFGVALVADGNRNQPAPVLTAAARGTDTVRVAGTLTAAANTAYRVEVFASPSATPGQGRTLLGFVTATTDASGVARFSFTAPLAAGAGPAITATATDPASNTSAFSATLTATTGVFAVGAGSGSAPLVNVYNPDGSLRLTILAFDVGFQGGVSVAVGDVNGDGFEDIVVGAGAGAAGGHVSVFDGATGAQFRSFFAFAGYFGGVVVAAGDLDGDGRAEVIVAAASGSAGGHVKAFSGATGAEVRSFMAFPGWTGSVTVAAGDVDGDGRADIIVGAGAPGGHVKAFSGADGGLLRNFFAFPGFAGGLFVAAGDLDGDGFADIIAGAGPGADSHVKVFSGPANVLVRSFDAFAGFAGGVRVGAADVNGDGFADIIAGAGPGAGAQVTVFDATSLAALDSFFALGAFAGGVFVGGPGR